MVVLGNDPLTVALERFQELPIDISIAGGKIVTTGAVYTSAGAPAAAGRVSYSSVYA